MEKPWIFQCFEKFGGDFKFNKGKDIDFVFEMK